MTTQEQIEKDVNKALKAGDRQLVNTLRLVRSNLENARIEKGDLSEEEVIKVLQKEAKQRRDSIDSYEKGDRPDLAEKERAELDIIERYLPKQLSDQELDKIVDEAIESTGANNQADMGKVMGLLVSRVGGRADGSRLSAVVRAKLS